ncbi:MAG: M23 family metallopeptidase [Bacteroidales bacterium]
MSNSQFKFDPENLRYRELDNSLKRRLGRLGIYAVAFLVMAVVLNLFYSLFFDTPRERQIRRENDFLETQYEALLDRKEMVDTVMSEVERIDKDIYRVIFETEPVDPGIYEPAGINYKQLLKSSNGEIVYFVDRHLDSLDQVNRIMRSEYRVLERRGRELAEALTGLPAIQPLDNPDLSLIASGFGNRMHPIYKIRRMHNGVDYSAPVGTPVRATADGVVREVIRSARGLGNQIEIDHGQGYVTLYACLDEIQVRRGDAVERGDAIGTVGDSGLSVAPHLHYEVRLNDVPVNPVNYFFLELGPKEYDRLILISMMSGQSFD